MRVRVSTYVFAPPAIVWDVLVDWERQAEWMVDARSVSVVSERRAGEGVVVEVPTRLLGLTVLDTIEVTGWRERERLEVRHIGWLIRGHAAFDLHPTGVGTRLTWWEQIDPPLGVVGQLAAHTVVRPYVTWMFRRSVANLKRLAERDARRVRAGRDSGSV